MTLTCSLLLALPDATLPYLSLHSPTTVGVPGKENFPLHSWSLTIILLNVLIILVSNSECNSYDAANNLRNVNFVNSYVLCSAQ